MPDDDDDDIGMEQADEDPNNLEDLVGADMAIEVQEICNRAHTLLGAEVVGGYGAAEMQRVLPRYSRKGCCWWRSDVAGREHFNQPWEWTRDALKDKGRGKAGGARGRCMSGWRNT